MADVQAQANQELGQIYLEPQHRTGWALAGDEVAGRFVWDDNQPGGRPYAVVVDGRTLTWDELGEALEAYEGWCFRLLIKDRLDDRRHNGQTP